MPLLLHPTRPALLLLVALAILLPATTRAHSTGENYVFLNFRESTIDGVLEIHFDDLEAKLGIKTEGVDPNEVVAQSEAVALKYINEHFSIGPVDGDPFVLEFTKSSLLDVDPNLFGQYHFRSATGPLPDVLAISHTMCYENDPLHRGLVCVQDNIKTGENHGAEYVAMVFGPNNPEQTLTLTSLPGLIMPREMVTKGLWSFLAGFDHLLFLLAILLTTVLRRRDDDWEPASGSRPALLKLLATLAVFVVAHSAAYLLAALGYLDLPARLAETAIALSIIVVALHNLTGFLKGTWLWVVFILSFFHGLGLASAVAQVPFRVEKLFKSVIGFNVGVEVALGAVVVILFPLLFLLRNKSFYLPTILRGGSTVILLAGAWIFAQRALGL